MDFMDAAKGFGDVFDFTFSSITTYQALFATVLIILSIFAGINIRRIVTIYNFDSEGKMHRIGWSRIRVSLKGYSIYIPDTVEARTFSNEYVIVTDCFSLGWIPGADVLVYSDRRETKGVLAESIHVTLK